MLKERVNILWGVAVAFGGATIGVMLNRDQEKLQGEREFLDKVYHTYTVDQSAQTMAMRRLIVRTFAPYIRGGRTFELGCSDAVRRHSLDTSVLLSSTGLVYRPSEEALTEDHPIGPTNPYALSKLAQEMLANRFMAEDGGQVVIARAFNHTGPGQDPSFSASGFARQIARIEAGMEEDGILVGNLAARREVTDVRDTVSVYQALADRGVSGRSYNVCSG